MLKTINSLRAVFAILIFLHHSPLNDDQAFYFAGSLSVSFFMMLSGFALSLGYEDKVTSGCFAYKDFIVKRLVRVYPLHLLMFLAMLALEIVTGWADHTTLPKALLNVTLLQAYVPVRDVYYSFNAPSWFLCCLVLFYLLFPWLCRVLNGGRGRLLAIAIGLVAVMLSLNALMSEAICDDVLYVNPVCRLADFVVGMLVYKVYKSRRGSMEKRQMWHRNALEMLSLAVIIGTVFASEWLGAKWQLAVIWWLPCAMLILVFSWFDANGGTLTKILQTPWLMKLGSLSFTVYMIHQFVLRVMVAKVPISNALLMTSAAFVATLVGAYVVHNHFEKKITIK